MVVMMTDLQGWEMSCSLPLLKNRALYVRMLKATARLAPNVVVDHDQQREKKGNPKPEGK